MKSILTPFQKSIFEALCRDKFIIQNFRFAGGTALSEFYLKHRYSEDLDFFTDEELPIEEIRPRLSPIFKQIGIETVEYRETLSSKIFFLNRR
ncbi:nucleotidyl transferase AbiEii/AbiGii toxin family protein [Patescibacteria group bacterium]|nr:nucleotidyl transferase AbiEii/AbiGii toxin family protein [Patescibacteria group bacterium]